MSSADIIIYDTVGWPIDMGKPLGGSETALKLLADALSARGHSVDVTRHDLENRRCKALIVSRYSQAPQRIRADRVVCYASDMLDGRYTQHVHLPTACVSRYHAAQFPKGWQTRVIYPMLGEHVYARAAQPRIPVPGRWIYASSINKGLLATLQAWEREPAGTELLVTTTGYDEAAAGTCERFGARWIGRISPLEMPDVMAECEGLFYVNAAPETFGVTTAIARVLGLKLRVRCEGHEPCALVEAQQDIDQHAEAIADQWEEFLFPRPRRAVSIPGRAASVALGIPHTPWVRARVASMDRLRQSLDLPGGRGNLAHYKEFSERAPNPVWSEQMWRWGYESGADWFLTLQDDVEVAPAFWPALSAQLEVLDEVGAEMLGLPSTEPMTVELGRQGHRWYRSSAHVVGWAYAMRRETLGRFLAWRAEHPVEAEHTTEDSLVANWATSAGIEMWHPIPTIVNHNTGLDSEYGNDHHPLRRPFVLWYDYGAETLARREFWRPSGTVPRLQIPSQRNCWICLMRPKVVSGQTGVGICGECLIRSLAMLVQQRAGG